MTGFWASLRQDLREHPVAWGLIVVIGLSSLAFIACIAGLLVPHPVQFEALPVVHLLP